MGGITGLYPYSLTTPLPYRILHEFFAYPEKFQFVELKDEKIPLFQGARVNINDPELLELHFIFDGRPHGYEEMKVEDWQLYCTPIVNLFPVDDLPISVGKGQTKIVPDPENQDHFGVYSVEKVAFWDNREKDLTILKSDISLGFQPAILHPQKHYRLNFKPTLSGDSTDAFLMLHGISAGEIIRVDTTCTNKELPSQLTIGDICVASKDGAPDSTIFSNILPVTVPSQAPCPEGVLWELFSDATPTTIPLQDVASFRAIIRTYHFRARHDARCARELDRYLLSITKVSMRELDRLYKGGVIQGMQTLLTIDEKLYADPGEMYLFCAALNAFLVRHVTRGSFNQTAMTLSPSNTQILWPVSFGQTDL